MLPQQRKHPLPVKLEGYISAPNSLPPPFFFPLSFQYIWAFLELTQSRNSTHIALSSSRKSTSLSCHKYWVNIYRKKNTFVGSLLPSSQMSPSTPSLPPHQYCLIIGFHCFLLTFASQPLILPGLPWLPARSACVPASADLCNA